MNCDTRLVPLIVQWPTHLQCMSHVPWGQEIVALGMFDPVYNGVVYCVCVLAMLVIMWFILSEIDVSFKLSVIATWPRCNVAWLQVWIYDDMCYCLDKTHDSISLCILVRYLWQNDIFSQVLYCFFFLQAFKSILVMKSACSPIWTVVF